jgi:ABC transporter substrate binding protein
LEIEIRRRETGAQNAAQIVNKRKIRAGLMSYGASQPDLFQRAAGYVHRVLQGTKPSDLPVEQPVKFDLVVNLKTAKAVGLRKPLPERIATAVRHPRPAESGALVKSRRSYPHPTSRRSDLLAHVSGLARRKGGSGIRARS